MHSIKMRCAIRYIVSIFIAILVVISLQLSLFSDRTINLLRSRQGYRDFVYTKEIIKLNRRISDNRTTNFDPWKGKPIVEFQSEETYRNSTVARSWREYRSNPNFITGNPLIDNYGQNDPTKTGENGRGVTFVGEEKKKSETLLKKYNLNVYASDMIPLNRKIPDSRFTSCQSRTYPTDLPSVSIIIPFYDEWPSVLLRTIYSIVNRSPRQYLQEIILVDDASNLMQLKGSFRAYIEKRFPKGLVNLIRLKERVGLIKARMLGWRNSTGEVIIFLDSHMEVNIDWLPPLLTEIKQDRKTIAMGVLDYIQANTLEYKFYDNYMTRYGHDWRLVFFETFFRDDQVGKTKDATRVGTIMVGAAFAIDSKFFKEMGAYDEGMSIWGGENLEMAWRIWLCGGRLVHVPCTHIGHIARTQPYSFPGGRSTVELFNYKRAIEVWMEPEHKNLLYGFYPQMKTMDVGDLTQRLELKKRLQCKPFSWFIDNIWPELFVYNKDVVAWGSARNLNTNKCLDNHQYLFQAAEKLYAEDCHYSLPTQGFSLTNDKLLRTSLQCVVYKGEAPGARPQLEDCIIGPKDKWLHKRGGYIKHEKTGFCLDMDVEGPIMKPCDSSVITQLWQFNTYVEDTSPGAVKSR